MKSKTTKSDLMSKSIKDLVKMKNSKFRPKIRQCLKCGTMFYAIWNYSLCEDCREEVSEQESEVRDYVIQHPNATVLEVTENIKVTPEFIQRMLDEGKLQLRETGVVNQCKSCGRTIATGNYCPECMNKMRDQFESAKKNILSNMNQLGYLDESKRTTGDKIRTDFHPRQP